MLANRSSQPQSSGDHHREGHPDRFPLGFDLDFIGLYMLQVELALAYNRRMDGFAMRSRPHPLFFDRPFIKTKSHDNSRYRRPIGQQCQHQHHCDAICLQPIEQCPLACAEGRVTFRTVIALLRLTVNLDVFFVLLPFCMTFDVRAKYALWIHGFTSLVW